MRKSTSLSGLSLAAAVAATLAAAASPAPAQISYVSQSRSCETNYYDVPTPYGRSQGLYNTDSGSSDQSAPDFGPFNGDCLTSTLNPGSITASGGSFYDPTGGGNLYDSILENSSDMSIRFRLTQPALFASSLNTDSGSSRTLPPEWKDQVFHYSLTALSGQNWTPNDVIMPAGDYRLSIGADVTPNGVNLSNVDYNYYYFNYDLNCSLGPVPEPSALGLLAVGMLGLLGRRPTLNA